jgi:sarcosine oxidase subunit gamma
VTADPAPLRRSPLAHRAADLARASSSRVRLAELPFCAMVNLRVDPGSVAAHRIGSHLGADLPPPNTVAGAGDRSLLWLGPDEWLVTEPDADAVAVLDLLATALDGDPGSLVDVSAHRTTVAVRGADARDLLEKGCAIDLHPRAFAPGRCAQTTLGRTLVVVWHVGDEEYRLLVGSSFAGYLADWLVDAAAEYAG